MSKTFQLIVVLLTLLLSSPCTSLAVEDSNQNSDTQLTYQQLEIFANVLSILQDNYVEEIDTKEIIDGAIKGLLYSLDPHSAYLQADAFRELQEETQGEFTGIGIEITIKEGILTIISPIEGTPAEKAGLKANDIIVEIDGKKTKEMGSVEAIKQLRGPKGSSVTLTIYREGWGEVQTKTLIRDIIPLQSVKSYFLQPGIAYTRITTFQSHTTQDYKDNLKKLFSQQKVSGLILDLRNNPGGLLNQAVGIADIFIDEGLLVYTKGRTKEQNMSFKASKTSDDIDVPLVLLVNEGSASASEIVAGALKAHKRAIIVGTTTFGKGSVQTIIPLPDGAGLRMTTARYYTPDNVSIQALGITPDVEVKFIQCLPKSDDGAESETQLREVDLPNHFPNKPDTAQQDSLQAKEIQEKLELDNQLRTALNILKSIELYSSYAEN